MLVFRNGRKVEAEPGWWMPGDIYLLQTGIHDSSATLYEYQGPEAFRTVAVGTDAINKWRALCLCGSEPESYGEF